MNFTATLNSMGQGLCYALVSILFIFLAKKMDDWRTKDFDDDRHIDDGNVAVGLRRAGLYLGIAIGMIGPLSGDSAGFRTDMLYLLVDGVIITGCLFFSRFLNDFIMMGRINNDRECVKVFILGGGRTTTGNTALGMVEAGMYIATGCILNGSMSGGGGSFIQSLGSALLFFVLGQIVLLTFGLVYELTNPFNVRDEIKRNNLAAGIGLAGILVALGIILKSSLSGPFTGWLNDIIGFFVYTVFGMVLLLGFSALVDRFLLPTTNIATEIKEDQNVAALVVVQATIIAVALIIAHAI
ncbi:DUF350 domain-containing protein [Desulfobacter postgatei]|jgi:uncharacterized membrane protein YjfL (UPF0719 family)|uniref:DUF350 domain-containing protein n=1 Tax=Desulfobacter postgatei TaxID=2293 RepID=UPI002A37003A|nr:DUF350 domain-containing protein [Desulfobacter postgatei]MDX9963531.1 DUF350 domain-containing protein [Desulfobacter postgatei]